eukprot:5331016-Ditylum_brightwellii.AAC.1
MKKKLQEGLVDKERNREMQDLIAHYQSNEAEIYAFIECSCNIENKIEAFIEILDENMPTPVASVGLGIGVREAFLNLHNRATADRAIDVDDDDIVHHQVINDAMISTRLLFSVTPENLAEVHFVARLLDGLTDATTIII